MDLQNRINLFQQSAENAGAVVHRCHNVDDAAAYIAQHAGGPVLYAPNDQLTMRNFNHAMARQQVPLLDFTSRLDAADAVAGVTGSNYGLAETGTVVIDSTPELVRLASTLPERHFVILDPSTIIIGQQQAGEALRGLQQQSADFLAYITGPSRTADIERVLTIGVHGPCELYVLLLSGLLLNNLLPSEEQVGTEVTS